MHNRLQTPYALHRGVGFSLRYAGTGGAAGAIYLSRAQRAIRNFRARVRLALCPRFRGFIAIQAKSEEEVRSQIRFYWRD